MEGVNSTNLSRGLSATTSENPLPADTLPDVESIVKSAFIAVVVASSLVGNFFITVSYFQNFKMRTVTNTLVLNMSFADELSALLDVPFYVVPLLVPRLMRVVVFCEVITYFDGFLKVASTLSMCGIALDRHLNLVKGKNKPRKSRHKQWMTRRRAKITIAVSWFVAFAASLPWASWDSESDGYCPRSRHDYFGPSVSLPAVVVFSKIAFIIVPFLGICLVLYRLLTLVRRRRRVDVVDDASVFSCSSAEHQAVRAYARSSITAVILLGMYVLCTLPFCAGVLYWLWDSSQPLGASFSFVFHLLFRLKATLFPLVYVIRNRIILSLVQQKLDCCSTQPSTRTNNLIAAFVVSRSNAPSSHLYLHRPTAAVPSESHTEHCDEPVVVITTDSPQAKPRVSYSKNNGGAVRFDTLTDLEYRTTVPEADQEVRVDL